MGTLIKIARDYKTALQLSHRNVRLFFLATFLEQIGFGVFSVLYNLYITSLGLPVTVAGSYVSANSLAGALFLVPAGILSDRFGRKRAIVLAGFCTSLLYLLQSFVQSPGLIVVTAFLTGMVGCVIWVSALPLLAENTAPEERMHLFSVNFGLVLVANVIGSLGGGALADFFGVIGFSPITSIRLTLLLGAALGLLALIPFQKIESTKRESVTSPQVREQSFETVREADRSWLGRLRPRYILQKYRSRRSQYNLIIRFTTCSALIGFGAGLVIPYLNLYFADRFQLSKSGIGTIMALGQAMTAFTMFIGPETAKRLGAVRAVVLFELASIPFLLFTGYSTTFWLVCVAVVIRQALMNSANPIQDSIMMELVDDDLRAFAVSCGQTAFSLGWALMGPVSTAIVNSYGSYYGYATVFTCTAVLYLIGATFYYLSFQKRVQKRLGIQKTVVSESN
jgi:MFS family permease